MCGTRKAEDARRQHLNTAHKYQPFPVERLVAATAAVPASSFLPVERCLTAFGRSSVLMRAQNNNHFSRGAQAGGQQQQYRQYSGGAAAAASASADFQAPPSPFLNSYQSRGPPLSRFAVDEPELCLMNPEAAALVRLLPRSC